MTQVMTAHVGARKMELGELWLECEEWGAVNVFTHPAHVLMGRQIPKKYSAKITRHVGESKLETSHKAVPTPEQALLHALEEAELWGLPRLENAS